MSAKRETDSKFASASPLIGRRGTTWLPHRLPPLLRIGQFSHAGFRSRQCARVRARSLSRACVFARRTLLRSGCVHAHEHACTRVENLRTRRYIDIYVYIHACERGGALARPRPLLLPPSRLPVSLLFLPLARVRFLQECTGCFRRTVARLTSSLLLAFAVPVFILERLLYQSIGYFFPLFFPPLSAAGNDERPPNESKIRIFAFNLHLYRRLADFSGTICNLRLLG